jgi:hypothetical protein
VKINQLFYWIGREYRSITLYDKRHVFFSALFFGPIVCQIVGALTLNINAKKKKKKKKMKACRTFRRKGPARETQRKKSGLGICIERAHQKKKGYYTIFTSLDK